MVLGSEDFSVAKPSLQCGWVLGLRSGVAVDLTLDRDSCRLQGLCWERALLRASDSGLTRRDRAHRPEPVGSGHR